MRAKARNPKETVKYSDKMNYAKRTSSETTHGLTGDFERARAPLLAARLKVVLAGRLGLGGGLAVMWAAPGGLQAGALSGAAGQVVVGGGVPDLGPLWGQTSAGRFGQREGALLLLGVLGGGGWRQPQSLRLQGFGAPPGGLDHDVLKPL